MTTPEEHVEEIDRMEKVEKQTHPEFFNDNAQDEKPKRKRRPWFWLLIFLAALLVILAFYYFLVIDSSLNKLIGRHPNPVNEAENLISPDLLKGEAEGDVNVLFMGMNGEGDKYPYATNAIMLANYDTAKKSINTVSFTRDLLVPARGETRKINSICELVGENPLNCIDIAREVLEEITGIKMHYIFLADFQGFISMIDNTSRIKIDLKGKSKEYPFLKDNEFDSARDENPEIFHLNGEQALIFVRWPKDVVPDFGRIERQQIFMRETEKQYMNPSLLLNPIKLKALLETASDHARTDFQIWELAKFANYAASAELNKYSLSSDVNSQGGILKDSGKGDHSYVTIDGTNNFDSLKKFLNTIIAEN